MSRSALRGVPLSMLLLSAAAAQATAQNQGQITAEDALANAEAAYGPPEPDKKCDPANGDEIVVCADNDGDQSAFRVKSTAELDPTSEEALDDGLPRAPDVAGPGIFRGPPSFSFGAPPPPALIIDVTALPQAPEGSDADKIAKGEIPSP
ncbi:hypothetical protein [Pontixanthobacter sp.]|uniref:hypothetical protein n=1 Tax=Pontixanthobacter sp. TaxID=2792078 RepID=UPI003C7A25F6